VDFGVEFWNSFNLELLQLTQILRAENNAEILSPFASSDTPSTN
jgi:hypothetical protein